MTAVAERLEKLGFDGAFGKGNPLRVLNSSDDSKGEQFQSELTYMQVDMIPNNGKIKKVPVVVKTQIKLPDSKDPFDVRTQFYNEAVMYKSILRELGAIDKEICPNVYYAEVNVDQDPQHDIIVLEDLKARGYKVNPELHLDYDHVCLAMRKLGEFHGLSYKMKKTFPGRLEELSALLIHKKPPKLDRMHEPCIERGIKPLLEKSPSYSVINRVHKKISSKNIIEHASSLCRPEEPFSVIIHGDFNKSNVLYSYDSAGLMEDMKILDFGCAMYGDPTVDISFFLYLNTSPEARTKHWHEFLDSYWSGVISIEENPGFSFAEFSKNFAQKAVYGYFPCSHLLPVMLNPGCINWDEFDNMTTDQKMEFFQNLGGEQATAAIAAIVRHLLDEGYLEEYLLHFKYDEAQ